jgi:prolyl oligopeptidase
VVLPVESARRGPDGKWAKIADHADKIKRMALGLDGRLYALSLKDAPRGKIVSMPMSKFPMKP